MGSGGRPRKGREPSQKRLRNLGLVAVPPSSEDLGLPTRRTDLPTPTVSTGGKVSTGKYPRPTGSILTNRSSQANLLERTVPVDQLADSAEDLFVSVVRTARGISH